MNIIEKLNKLGSQLEADFDAINCGGCGVIASHIAKRLQHIVPTNIVVFNDDEYIKINKILPNLKNPRSSKEWNRNGMRWDHIVVEFEFENKLYMFDTEKGVFPSNDKYNGNMNKSGYLDIDVICAIAAKKYTWNWRFDRTQIPAIKKRISRALTITA